jgi:hypothetical protein
MGVGIGSFAAAVQVSSAASSGTNVQTQASISVLKKAQQVDAESIRLLIASAPGVGQRLDVIG